MLVIFLAVTTQFVAGGQVKIKLPKGGEKIGSVPQNSITLVIDKWGRIYYKGNVYTDVYKLSKYLKTAKRVYIKADRQTPYMFVFSVIDGLRKLGVTRISLVGQRINGAGG